MNYRQQDCVEKMDSRLEFGLLTKSSLFYFQNINFAFYFSPCGEGIKLNLLKSTVQKTVNSKTVSIAISSCISFACVFKQKLNNVFHCFQPVQEKKPTRVRKPRGKQPDPEPVILTLSSDEEDSNSSMMSNQVIALLIPRPAQPCLTRGNLSTASFQRRHNQFSLRHTFLWPFSHEHS